jgi:quinol monooxygenase YgiN
MKIITGIWKVKENDTTSFLNLCKTAKEHAIQESGSISFSYAEFKDTENTFLFFEEWEDQNAIDFHIAQWYFIEFMEKSNPLLIEDAIIKIYDIENFIKL